MVVALEKNHGRSRIWGRTNQEARSVALSEGKDCRERVRQSGKWAPAGLTTKHVGRDRQAMGRLPRSGSETRRAFRTRSSRSGCLEAGNGPNAMSSSNRSSSASVSSNRTRMRQAHPVAAWMLGAPAVGAGNASRFGRRPAAAVRGAAFFRRTEPHASVVPGAASGAVAHMPLERWLEEVIKERRGSCSPSRHTWTETASPGLHPRRNAAR